MSSVNRAIALLNNRVDEIDAEIIECYTICSGLANVDNKISEDTKQFLMKCHTAIGGWKSLIVERRELMEALKIINEK